jgi:hypothetical protein
LGCPSQGGLVAGFGGALVQGNNFLEVAGPFQDLYRQP